MLVPLNLALLQCITLHVKNLAQQFPRRNKAMVMKRIHCPHSLQKGQPF